MCLLQSKGIRPLTLSSNRPEGVKGLALIDRPAELGTEILRTEG
jgi:hypothetical protein